MTSERIDTRIARALADLEEPSGAIVPAIQPATTFQRGPDGELVGDFIYRRNDSPTVGSAERVFATIDGGEDALLFASGMAAVTAFFTAQPRGTQVVAPRVMYHGAQDWLRRLDSRGDIGLRIFDQLDTEGLINEVSGGADIVWIESPLNPTWEVIDIAAAAEAVHEVGGLLVVDSTVAPPVTTRPLELGADIVFHSGTKYLNGHSDVTAGLLVSASVHAMWREVDSTRVYLGSVISPFDAWLLLRGVRTLGVRYRRASETALFLASKMEGAHHVGRVLYPGLPSHPHHEVAKRQMTGGFGGMVSLLVDGGPEFAAAVTASTEVFTTATSLGGTESLIEHRARVEGPNSVVPTNLLRLSIGLEDPRDLGADLEQAIRRAGEGREG